MHYFWMTGFVAWVASFAGVGLTAFGLYGMHHPQVHTSLLVTVLAVALLLGLVSRFARVSTWTVTLFASTLLTLSTGTLWQGLVVVWFGIASLLLGKGLLKRLDAHSADWASQTLFGAGLLGTVVGLLAHLPVASAGTYGLLLAAPLLLSLTTLKATCAKVDHWPLFKRGTTLSPLALTLDCLLGAVGVLYLVFALAPEVGHDALAMHLFIPGYLQSHGQWSFDAGTYVWAVMPMLGDWIFSLPYLLAGESAARLTNVGFIFLLVWLVSDLARWAGANAMGARWAALIFLTTPLTFTEGSSLFIESVWSCLVVAGVFAVLKVCFDSALSGQRLLLGGALLGLALATKAVTLPLLPIVLLLLMWKQSHWLPGNATPRQWQTGVLLFCALGVIPYATAWWLTGNPTFPFFNAIFKSPLWEPVNFQATAFGKGVPWDVLYAVTFDSGRFLEGNGGAGGFQWLLLFVPLGLGLVGARHAKAMVLMFFGVATVFLVFNSTAYLRYVFPAYAVLASVVGAGFAMTELWSRLLHRWFLFLGFLTFFLGTGFLTSGAFQGLSAWNSVWNSRARAQYLETRLPIRNAVPVVNAMNIGKRPVAFLSEPLSAGLDSDALYVSWYNLGMQTPYFAAKTDAELAKVLVAKGVELMVVDKGWNADGNLSAEQLALVPMVSDLIWQQGPVSVRKIKATFQHTTEYLHNPNFESTANWSLPGKDMYDSLTQSVRVSVVSGWRSHLALAINS
jgi:hypothetical protein